jgi:hypothetical protein
VVPTADFVDVRIGAGGTASAGASWTVSSVTAGLPRVGAGGGRRMGARDRWTATARGPQTSRLSATVRRMAAIFFPCAESG